MYGLLVDLYHASVKHLPSLKFSKGSEVHRTLISLYATTIELTNSAIIIREGGGHTGMDILLRTAMEGHVDLINLASDDAYLQAMNAAYHKEWIKLSGAGIDGDNPFLAFFKDNPEAQGLLAQHKEKLAAFKAKSSIPTNLDKFKKAGMEDIYRSIYSSLCSDSHNNIGALNHRHFRPRDGDLDLVIFDVPLKTDLAATLDMFISILLKSNEIMHDYFGSAGEVKDELAYFRRVRDENGPKWVGDLGL